MKVKAIAVVSVSAAAVDLAERCDFMVRTLLEANKGLGRLSGIFVMEFYGGADIVRRSFVVEGSMIWNTLSRSKTMRHPLPRGRGAPRAPALGALGVAMGAPKGARCRVAIVANC